MPDSQNELDFGQYRIQRLLGRGGMGEVYLARDTSLERHVAIKFVNPARLRDAQARTRLLQEAQAAARLDHPAICAVHEAGVTPDGRAYIVMPFVDGTPLSELIHHGAMPIRDALSICAQISEALSVAHRHGIVHRDLKPGNVIVSPTGRPRLLDFGLAQSSSVPRVVAEAPTVTVAADTPGALVGTPSYMSPEQIQRRPVDGRSDLFALGVMLYECLTGRRAFDGATPYEAMTSVVHSDPPPPSTIRRELTDRHDALCARLMAKDPNDRFQSADEVVGAIRVLVPDTGRITDSSGKHNVVVPPQRQRAPAWLVAVAVGVLLSAVGGFWLWQRPTRLPSVPLDSQRWYQRGVDALRDGAYQNGHTALERAVALFPQNALAYARLAEADMELDDERAAQTDLIRLSSIVSDESRLPVEEQLRVRAVKALVLRDLDGSIGAYRDLVNRDPDDAGAWVDLGQAQDAAGLRDDARASFERAIRQDPEYAAAFLQLGSIEAAALRLEPALKAFDQAERLYQAASNTEGQTEVLLRRSGLLDGSNEVKRARADAERAAALASASKNVSQQLRARLTLASIAATEGRSSEALAAATAAVADATVAGLDTVAAGGLIDLAATLNDLDRFADAAVPLQRAMELADAHVARRTGARARVQLAELRRLEGRNQDAIDVVNGVLPAVRKGQYRRLEMTALLIQARAHLALGHLRDARTISSSVLSVAEALKDDGRIALAASDMAAVDTQFGEYPAALALRERAAPIYRRQGDQMSLAYSLVNHAELLIRLGRAREAAPLLAELEAGKARGLEAYARLDRRLVFLRILDAVTALRCREVTTIAASLPTASPSDDQASVVAPGMLAFCDARSGLKARGVTGPPGDGEAWSLSERDYWMAAAALTRGNAEAAVDLVQGGLKRIADPPNDDLRWQLAAIGMLASRALGQHDLEARMRTVSSESFSRLESDWKNDFAGYLSRADVADLRSRAEAAR